jgi:LCP family protein required for cell wall assembly
MEDHPMARLSFLRRMAAPILAIVVALLLATSPAIVAAQADPTPDVTSDPVNILLLGSDKRPGEAIDAVRSDIMAVLHLDPTAKTCRLLHIPRDSRVEMPGIGFTKINHALMEGGVPLATQTVEGFLGIEIDHYGVIDFEGAAIVIDALGGVTIHNEYAFDLGGNHYPAGEQHLDGAQAVLYARYRYGPDGDFGRMHRQQVVFQALIRDLDPAAIPALLQATWSGLGDHLMTDLTPETLLALATTYAGSCTSETLGVDIIPDSTQGMAWDDLFAQELWFVIVDPAIVQQKVAWLLGTP